MLVFLIVIHYRLHKLGWGFCSWSWIQWPGVFLQSVYFPAVEYFPQSHCSAFHQVVMWHCRLYCHMIMNPVRIRVRVSVTKYKYNSNQCLQWLVTLHWDVTHTFLKEELLFWCWQKWWLHHYLWCSAFSEGKGYSLSSLY